MKKVLAFVFLFLPLAAGLWADTDVTISRAQSRINAGFKERVYIDGKRVLELGNGDSRTVKVTSGDHVIYAELYTMTTPKLSFSAGSAAVSLTITPYDLKNFVIEQNGQALTLAVPTPASAPAPVPATAAPSAVPAKTPSAANTVEASLERAAYKIMEAIPPKTRIAIVYVTADDNDVAEFITYELEYHLVENDHIVIDRSQLDQIRKEQRLQISGEVDDNQAVSIGKIAGANIILTGAVTGRGDLRRLRVRAMNTQDAQVLTTASEKF
jgi:hypothetical protein